MLDIKRIRENTEEVKKALLKKMDAEDLDLESIIALDDSRKIFTAELLVLNSTTFSNLSFKS